MRVSACLQAAMAVTLGASPATTLVIRDNGSPTKSAIMIRDLGCNKDAIDACVRSTGQDRSVCFGHLCAGKPIENMAKRQDDCTEEKLLQCTVLDWNEAQVCFQQLCL
ncbi:hypothetical protein F5X97DRAFT_284411 [Nemania serpens]|nr:hypothetical protein F5X97DRAFT_284411 [Nemania serpens]